MPTSTVPKSVNMLPYDKCKRDFADVIKFRILSWGDYLELPDGFHVITRILRKGRERERERERERAGESEMTGWKQKLEP